MKVYKINVLSEENNTVENNHPLSYDTVIKDASELKSEALKILNSSDRENIVLYNDPKKIKEIYPNATNEKFAKNENEKKLRKFSVEGLASSGMNAQQTFMSIFGLYNMGSLMLGPLTSVFGFFKKIFFRITDIVKLKPKEELLKRTNEKYTLLKGNLENEFVAKHIDSSIRNWEVQNKNLKFTSDVKKQLEKSLRTRFSERLKVAGDSQLKEAALNLAGGGRVTTAIAWSVLGVSIASAAYYLYKKVKKKNKKSKVKETNENEIDILFWNDYLALDEDIDEGTTANLLKSNTNGFKKISNKDANKLITKGLQSIVSTCNHIIYYARRKSMSVQECNSYLVSARNLLTTLIPSKIASSSVPKLKKEHVETVSKIQKITHKPRER